MASQSLYRKWRSQTFGDLVGQEPIIRTLQNALSNSNLAHAYLFTGPRGTGKTSTARLLAKTVNCEHPVNGEPCNICQQCREITAGNSFNVIEIDAASNRGIDSIRDLREKVMMPPSTGKYKVYVLDEAHMLTTEAFNALLKTLEEPPDYAIFVMATTDVHKMLPTVLSRCQRFDFKRITTRQIVEHVLFVAKEEHVKIERSAAELIARAAAGGMRDALSLLDQAIAYSGGEISLAQVQAMLGVADPRAIQKLIDHVSQLDSAATLHLIHELSEAGADLRQINIQVGEYWRAMMLAKAGADIATILDRTEDETREIQQMTQLFELDELTEFARIFAQNDLMQKNQGTPQLGLELAFLHSIGLHQRAQAGQSLLAPPVPVMQQRSIQAQPPSRPAVSYARPQPPQTQEAIVSSPVLRQPTPPQAREEYTEALSELNHSSFTDEGESDGHAESYQETPIANSVAQSNGNTAMPVSSQPALTLQQIKEAWERVKKRVKQKNKQTSALLEYCNVVSIEGSHEQTVVVLQPTTKVFYDHMQQGERSKFVEWALNVEFEQKCRVRLILPDQPMSAPTAQITSSPSVHTAILASPQQPAHRERPNPAPPSSAKPNPVEQEQSTNHIERTQIPPTGVARQTEGDSTPPVAKKNIVRENIMQASPQLSLDVIKHKASSDPVVQEVVRTFNANIVDIRPK